MDFSVFHVSLVLVEDQKYLNGPPKSLLGHGTVERLPVRDF